MKTMGTYTPRINWLAWGIGTGAIILVFHEIIVRLATREWSRADFDYCYLIPFTIAYLVWERKDELEHMPSKPSWSALGAFVIAGGLLLLGELGGEYLTLYLALWWAVFGVCWAILGWTKMRLVIFPIILLLTAFPPPNYIYSRLTIGMQLLSTQLGTALLHLFKVPAYQNGNTIDLGFAQLEVVAACSGLRFLIPLFIVGMLLTYFFRDKWWKRLLLMLSTLPLAIIMNGVRIGLTGLLARSYGLAVLEEDAHELMGWIMFLLSTGVLFGLMRLLAGRNKIQLSRKASTSQPIPPSPQKFWRTQPLVAGLLLILLAHGYLGYREATPDILPEAKPLASFPLTFDGWNGRGIAMEQRFIDTLDFTDYVQIDYQNNQGRMVDFYVAWYQSQSKGESIHSPETCLRGGGWEFLQSQATELNLPGHAPMRVNRALLDQNGQRMLSYFWFPARGRYLTNGLELKLYTFWDSLTKRRSDGALVRLITPLYPQESEQDGEARLHDLLQHIIPVLENLLPGADYPAAAEEFKLMKTDSSSFSP
ncbi:hypothetical protein AXF15_00870 [Desulfomicrobium orale DSM 12838]|uniref:Methanolan biosynthesis EpsI domain-containing protein n=2 Tax=Desulfomicrobium orale TaxID=132132 RepID=A0A0X8JNF4_9BACT|nr:hypothetical protein AXF15_00870 [Desulfomicrobium orale DSM 12838]